jgi:hypothetical protein
MTSSLSNQALRAIAHKVDLLDVLHGEIKVLMVEWQNKKFDSNLQGWADGYQDCLTDIYGLCYDVIFYNQSLEKTQ